MLRFLPTAVVGICINAVVIYLSPRLPAEYLLIIGTLGTSIAPLLFAVQDVNSSYWTYQFFAMGLSVLGADFIFSLGIMYVSTVAAEEGEGSQGLAGGIFNSTTR